MMRWMFFSWCLTERKEELTRSLPSRNSSLSKQTTIMKTNACVCVRSRARVCAAFREREEVKMKSFFLVSTKSNVFTERRQTLNFFFVLVLLSIFVNPTAGINSGSVGLVGYNVRLTKASSNTRKVTSSILVWNTFCQ